jgi:hypothetical protein
MMESGSGARVLVIPVEVVPRRAGGDTKNGGEPSVVLSVADDMIARPAPVEGGRRSSLFFDESERRRAAGQAVGGEKIAKA